MSQPESLWTFNYALRRFPAYRVVQSPAQRLEPLLESLQSYHRSTVLGSTGKLLVCDVSSNYLRFEDACYLADWLEQNDLRLRGLNLARNMITCKSWPEVLRLVQNLQHKVAWIHLGGNWLPLKDEADPAVVTLREDGHVSLTVGGDFFSLDMPGTWSPQWEPITRKVEAVIYGPDDDRCNHQCPSYCKDYMSE